VKTIHMTDNLVFSDAAPSKQPLLSDQIGKIARLTLKKDQEVDEFHAPYQPHYYVVVSGEALFRSTSKNEEEKCGPGSLVVFAPKEQNAIIALSDEVVIISFFHWPSGG